jgi:hypothetical protein
MNADTVEHAHDQDQAGLTFQVSDEMLEDAGKGECSAGRLMLSATYWGCPC